jgi:hypothetical protein
VKRIAISLAVVVGAGCSAHTKVRVDAASGTSGSSTASSVQVRGYSGSDLVTFLGLTLIAATIVEMERARGADPGRVPEMAADRIVSEHDCTVPVAGVTGNLRCR